MRDARSHSLPTLATSDRSAMTDSKPSHEPDAADRWSGRFAEAASRRMQRYTASVRFDRRLVYADIAGSLAHARMLATVGVLTRDDLDAIERGMDTIRGEVERDEFPWSDEYE